MALTKTDSWLIFFLWCFIISEGAKRYSGKQSRPGKRPGISFSFEVGVAIVIGFFTILLLIYWFYIRPNLVTRRNLQHRRLNRFLLDFWKQDVIMKPLPGTREYNQISRSVRQVVEEIVANVFSCEDTNMEKEQENVNKYIELVGSCQEGSKVERPDEFDFSIKLPYFSSDNVFVEHGCTIKPTHFMCIHRNILHNYDNAFAQLRYTGKIDEKSKIFKFLTKVKDNYYISAFKLHSFFKSRIRIVVKEMVRNKYFKKRKSGILIVRFPNEDVYNSDETGPAWTLPLRWRNNKGDGIGYRINVDIVPVILLSDSVSSICIRTFENKDLKAIRFMPYPALCIMLGIDRYEYTSDLERMEGGTFTLTYADVMERVSDDNRLFTELSFLTSHVHHENALMKELKNSFQSIFITYQIFKRLDRLWSRIKINGQLHGLRFHSYILKTIILEEITKDGKKISKEDDVATCFRVILKRIVDLHESCLLGNHESVNSLWFDDHVLTCAQLPQVYTHDQEYVHAFRQQFLFLWNLVMRVENDADYSYFRYQREILDRIRTRVNFRIPSDSDA